MAESNEVKTDRSLVRLRDIELHFDVSPSSFARFIERRGRVWLKAVDGISFSINRRQTFALVGESGCGKSTVARMIVGLYRPSRGSIEFDGISLSRCSQAELRSVRSRMGMIFQDPYASLNPRWAVRDIIAEPINLNSRMKNSAKVRAEVDSLLSLVKLSPQDGDKYPHEFSGGQRQRISIARALASKPEFIICDEPTSSVDVSVQAQILNLMSDLQDELGLTYLFISHNLAVVNHMAGRVGVMYLGRLAEVAEGNDLFQNPVHPYTRLLLETVPTLQPGGRERHPVTGEVPNLLETPPGCAFHPRCPLADARCWSERPDLLPLLNHPGRLVACHTVTEDRLKLL
jgi:peptide/nickel transport system ATP-binding protein